MKPKVALVKDGFLPAGSENVRGRLSAAAIERCKELAAKGWDIDGYTVSKSTAAEDKPVVEKVKHDPNRIPDVPDQIRDENDWKAIRYFEGKPVEVGMRTVCNVCRSSLTYCPCEKPRVWVDYQDEAVVYFKPRTKPLPKGW